MSTIQTTRGRTRPTARWPAAFAVAGAAVLAAVALKLVADLLGIDLVVETGGDRSQVTLASVIAGSAVGSVTGVLLLQVALRCFARGRRWWTIGAGVGLLGSLASPLAATTAGAWTVLSLMHLAVGGVVIVGLRSIAPRDVA